MREGRHAEAGDAFAEALREAPHSAFARGFLGWTELHQDNCALAVLLFEGTLRNAPDADVFRAPYIEALACAGRQEDARMQAAYCAQAGIALPESLLAQLH